MTKDKLTIITNTKTRYAKNINKYTFKKSSKSFLSIKTQIKRQHLPIIFAYTNSLSSIGLYTALIGSLRTIN